MLTRRMLAPGVIYVDKLGITIWHFTIGKIKNTILQPSKTFSLTI